MRSLGSFAVASLFGRRRARRVRGRPGAREPDPVEDAEQLAGGGLPSGQSQGARREDRRDDGRAAPGRPAARRHRRACLRGPGRGQPRHHRHGALVAGLLDGQAPGRHSVRQRARRSLRHERRGLPRVDLHGRRARVLQRAHPDRAAHEHRRLPDVRGDARAAGLVSQAHQVCGGPQGHEVPRHRDCRGSVQGDGHVGGQHRARRDRPQQPGPRHARHQARRHRRGDTARRFRRNPQGERKARENAFFAKVLESQKAWAQRVVPYRRCCHPPYEFAADYYWKGANPYKILKP
jgi:hypothetical protein